MTDAKKRIETFAARQRSRVYPCPRCGKPAMAGDPVRNALSRRADVYVCDACGMQEALEDMMDSRTPLEAWAISQRPERWAAVTENSEHVSVPGHAGTWYTIDSGIFVLTPDTDDGRPLTIRKRLFLMEHETYGDEAACVILDEDGALVLEDVWNGFDDLEEAGWERVAEHECPVCGKKFPRDEMRFTRDCHGITFRLVCMDCWETVMEKGYDGEYYTEADECIEEDY